MRARRVRCASGVVASGAVPSGVAGGVIPPRSRSPEASWDAAESSGFCETCQAATPRTSATAEVTAAIATAMRVRLRWLRYLVSQASAAGLPGRYPGAWPAPNPGAYRGSYPGA